MSTQAYKDGLKKRYGIEWDEYIAILRLQDFKCAVCGIHHVDYPTGFDIEPSNWTALCGRHKHGY